MSGNKESFSGKKAEATLASTAESAIGVKRGLNPHADFHRSTGDGGPFALDNIK